MKKAQFRVLIREEIKKSLTEETNPFVTKLDVIKTKIESLNSQIDKIVDQAINSVTLEIQGNKAIVTRKFDGKQFVTSKSSTSRSERTIKDMTTGKIWGLTRNMTLEKIKFAIAMDNPNTNPDYYK